MTTLKRTKPERTPQRHCFHCGETTRDHFMLEAELWNSINPSRKGFLHLKCVEEILGRDLLESDFSDAPINSGILFFLRKQKG